MSDSEAENLVKELKTWAAKNKKSQYSIAQSLGVDRERVSKWFSGKTVPSLQHGLKIQKFLKQKKSGST
jgi:transcriptional regulator with XRE-family HTH domain